MANKALSLSAAFHALSDPTRRAVISRLAKGQASVGELARPMEIKLPAFLKHIGVLEQCGLIETRKIGRTRVCRLEAMRLIETETWLSELRSQWKASADRLADFVENNERKDAE